MTDVTWKRTRGGVMLPVPPKPDTCKRNHEYTPENTIRNARSRHCRACKQEREREAWARLSPEERKARIARDIANQRRRRQAAREAS